MDDLIPFAPYETEHHLGEVLLGLGRLVSGYSFWDLPRSRVAICLLVDGLGWRQVQEYAGIMPTIESHGRKALVAPFPCSTPVSLATLGIGVLPGEHGMIASRMLLNRHRFHNLKWLYDKEGEESPDPIVAQPRATVPELVSARGIPVSLVSDARMKSAGYNIAVWRGGELYQCANLDEVAAKTIEMARRPGPRLIYAYTSMVDDAAHEFGVGSEQHMEVLKLVERAAVTFLRGLPTDAVLLLTADHGHVNLDRNQVVYSDRVPELKRGVRWVGGDLRAAQVYAKATTTDDAFERWQQFFGNDRWVVRREELITKGWFGSRVTDEVRTRIGDFLVIDKDRGGVAQAPKTNGKPQVSTHAAWTENEMLIPNVVLRP